MEIDIPGRGIIRIKNLLLDYNGTIACDGEVINSVKERIEAINNKGIRVHLITADSNGTARKECTNMPIEIHIINNSNAAANKREIAENLGVENSVCIGNGFNDSEMFEACNISIIVMGKEGCSAKSLTKADIVCKSIENAFDLILKPKRLIPTLRA